MATIPVNRQQIIINTSNYVGTNKYSYKFPSPVNFKNAKLSLYQINIYNSTYNISSTLGNNTFTINWLGTNYNYTTPNGYCSISQLNSYFQYAMLQNNLYVTNSAGSAFTYFFDIQTNSIQYATQMDIYYIPTSSQATTLGYIKPTGASWSFPASQTYPQVTLCSGLCSLLGITNQANNRFPSSTTVTIANTNVSFLSSTYPVVSPVFCYVLLCNLIDSQYNNVPTVLHQIPLNASYGNLITLTNIPNGQLTIRDGVYTSCDITLLDQNYNTLQFVDPEIVLSLLIETPIISPNQS